MRIFALAVAAILATSCSAPSEESPVSPATVCDDPNYNDSTCNVFEEEISNAAVVEGNVVSSAPEAAAVDQAEAAIAQAERAVQEAR